MREGFFLGGSISLAKNLVNDLEGQHCGGGSYFDFSSSRFAQNIWAYFKNFYVFFLQLTAQWNIILIFFKHENSELQFRKRTKEKMVRFFCVYVKLTKLKKVVNTGHYSFHYMTKVAKYE